MALQAGLAVVIVQVTDLRRLLGYLGFTLSLSAAATVAALFVQRRREGAACVPVVGYPFTPALFIGATLLFAAIWCAAQPGRIDSGRDHARKREPAHAILDWRKRSARSLRKIRIHRGVPSPDADLCDGADHPLFVATGRRRG